MVLCGSLGCHWAKSRLWIAKGSPFSMEAGMGAAQDSIVKAVSRKNGSDRGGQRGASAVTGHGS